MNCFLARKFRLMILNKRPPSVMREAAAISALVMNTYYWLKIKPPELKRLNARSDDDMPEGKVERMYVLPFMKMLSSAFYGSSKKSNMTLMINVMTAVLMN